MIDFALQKNLQTAEGEMRLNVSARIESGQFVGLYGASGAGKTAILRMLAGFMKPDDGFVKADGATWFDATTKTNIVPQQRGIGFVFQDYALFPNMNVRENIAFALRKNEPRDIVDELLELTGLSNLSARKTQTLSGGQQQRVALARALAGKPSVLLLDEPLSAIDQAMRAQLQDTLLTLHRRFSLTTILVSHSADEIIKLSDTVIHLEHGRFRQQAAPATFFLSDNDRSLLTGSIVSIAGDGTIVVQADKSSEMHSTLHELRAGDKITISMERATNSGLS